MWITPFEEALAICFTAAISSVLILAASPAAAASRKRRTLVRSAEARAADIEERAMRRSEEVHREAEAYAYRVLEKLREQIGQITQTVDRGLDELSSRTHASPGT